MKNQFKKVMSLAGTAAFVTALTATSQAQAAQGLCARGTVTQVLAGGWNQNSLMIRMDYQADTVPPNSFNGHIRFSGDLNETRLKAMQAMALLALTNGNTIEVYTHNGNTNGVRDCSNATQIRLCKPGAASCS